MNPTRQNQRPAGEQIERTSHMLSLEAEADIYNRIYMRIEKASDSLWEADRMTKAANIHFASIMKIIDERRAFIHDILFKEERS